jgi:hypothetical protein
LGGLDILAHLLLFTALLPGGFWKAQRGWGCAFLVEFFLVGGV